ncbi:Mss4-like protein [Nemania diffusa]|nr:Mss4-like protein [Nemania diffusa]
MASTTLPDHPLPKATCHCGRITVALPRAPEQINECHCSVCYKLGALWAYYPRDEVAVTASSEVFPASIVASPPSVSALSGHGTDTGSSSSSVTRGVTTAVDEALESYVRMDLPRERSGGGATFFRCAHCGALTHWWGVGRDAAVVMGVNCRLLPEGEIVGVRRLAGVC